ncbi:MAG: polyprenol monophosphomannose synthase [Patescibacteria group bacterium]|nr:polyprenol monophosphomannose synthase [Patescibacteria group bacterium]MDE1988290.1 polyprenol monophosphomannose synthase [Patescibacteria group bacterium]MDE2218060.1 polyprenol monophosphomannose synthase [Patescibacteria group bacterium]
MPKNDLIAVSLIIPTYNEAKNVPFLIEEIFGAVDKNKIDLEFIIVDDNSPDGTGKIAEELASKYPVRVIHRRGKLGLGTAVIEGFKLSKREYMGAMDGDMSHNPVILNQMISSLVDNDIAIGNRFGEGSGIENWGLHRRMISGAGVFLAKILTRTKDPLSGYFFMKKSVISGVKLKTTGYKILFEILVKGNYKKVKEFPYTFRMRKYSASKLNAKEFILFLGQIGSYGLYKIIKLFKS